MRTPGPLGAALAAAGSWLLEPAEPPQQTVASAAVPAPVVVAVFGLARGCGATVVARALAAELGRRDAGGAAAVHCEARAAGIPLATGAAGRLARVLAELPGAETRAVGRLCLIGGADPAMLAGTARHVAPLVLDSGSTSLDDSAAAIADEVVLVGTPSVAPALAAVATDCLIRRGHDPIVVLNRARTAPEGLPQAEAGSHEAEAELPEAVVEEAREPEATAPAPVPAPPALELAPTTRSGRSRSIGWARQAAFSLPDSRMGAQLALGGREARGDLGRAIARLADRCEGRRGEVR